jgi:hypothetical protein
VANQPVDDAVAAKAVHVVHQALTVVSSTRLQQTYSTTFSMTKAPRNAQPVYTTVHGCKAPHTLLLHLRVLLFRLHLPLGQSPAGCLSIARQAVHTISWKARISVAAAAAAVAG